MRLSNNQINDLALRLSVDFISIEEQQKTLRTIYKVIGETPPSDLINSDPVQFANTFIQTMQDKRLPSGESALVYYLKSHDLVKDESLRLVLAILERADTPSNAPSVTNTRSIASTGTHPVYRRKIPRSVRKAFRLIPIRVVLVVLLLALVIPTALLVSLAADSYARVQEATRSLQRVFETLSSQSMATLTLSDFDRLDIAAQNFSNNLHQADSQTRILRKIISFDKNLENQFKLLDAAMSTSDGLVRLIEGARPTARYLLVSTTSTAASRTQNRSGDQLIDLLRIGTNRFIDSKANVAKAEKIMQGIDPSLLPSALFLQYLELSNYVKRLGQIASALQKAPDTLSSLFAFDRPKSYLVLSQNNDELRPSGGYISTFGWVQLQSARLVNYGYSSTTPTTPNPPPAELVNELKVPAWWFKSPYPIMAAWSGSWYSDYSQTAQMALWYYNKGENPLAPVDGVIAIDITGFRYLLEALGDVTVPEYKETVNAANFRQVMYRLRSESQVLDKEFLAETYRQMLSNWQQISREDGLALLSAALRALQEKHIMVYSSDPAITDMLDLLNWNAKQTPGTGDYVMVADANLGNKSNSSVARELQYHVTIKPDKTLSSRLSVDYLFDAQVAANDPAVAPQHYGDQKDYYNLFQVYTPVGATLTKADGLQAEVTADGTSLPGMTVFATGFQVPFNSSTHLSFDYTLPDKIGTQGTYSVYKLLVQKQPGTKGDPLSVQVTLPPGVSVIRTSPTPTSSFTLDTTVLEFKTTLDLDREFEIIYR